MIVDPERRRLVVILFFFNDTATTEIYTLSLHDALPIFGGERDQEWRVTHEGVGRPDGVLLVRHRDVDVKRVDDLESGERSEEHTSELPSRQYLVFRLLLEKKKYNY